MTTVFQAEIFGINEALDLCLKENIVGQKVTVCSDSQSAIQALFQPETRSKLVAECKLNMKKVSENNELEVMWVPGHSDISGNEEADELARKGSESPPCAPEPILGVSGGTIKMAVKRRLESLFLQHWKRADGLRYPKELLPGPSAKYCRDLLSLDRKGTRAVIALLTGHGPFLHHLKRIGVVDQIDSTLCRCCGGEEETGRHLLLECPALCRLRFSYGLPNTLPSPLVVHKFARDANLIEK